MYTYIKFQCQVGCLLALETGELFLYLVERCGRRCRGSIEMQLELEINQSLIKNIAPGSTLYVGCSRSVFSFRLLNLASRCAPSWMLAVGCGGSSGAARVHHLMAGGVMSLFVILSLTYLARREKYRWEK
jgi:hypothetical protein